MIKSFHHIGISAINMEKLCEFYCNAFGFERLFEMEWKQGTQMGEQCDIIIGIEQSAAKVIMAQKGGLTLEFFQYSSPTPKPVSPDWRVCDHGLTHICFEVDDIDFEYERLSKAGMTFHACPPAVFEGMRAIYGRDPEGNVIELFEMIPSV
jgi:glyoxylase I family protein